MLPFLRRHSPLPFPPKPVSSVFGFDRGTPVDRYYIERFLREHADKIRGTVLEMGSAEYTRGFGATVERSLVFHATDPTADITGDLTQAEGLPESVVDCFILTQTFPFIYDVHAAVRGAWKVLKPGGHLLVTSGGITKVSRYDMDRWGHFWSFTDKSLRRLLEEVALPEDITVRTYGNVQASAAFLYGHAAEELTAEELDREDPDYQLLLAAVAKKR